MSLFGQEADTFTSTMLLNVDQLQKKLDKDEFQEDGSMATFWVVNNQFQKFIDSQFSLDYDSQMTDKYFVKYTGIEVKQFRDTLLQLMCNVKKSIAERTRHQRHYDRRVNKRQMQMQESEIDTGKAVYADLVVIESSGTESEVQDDNNRSGNDTDVDDADIRPIYDEEPMDKVQLTAECNIFTIGQQHTEQLEISHEGRVDQYPEQCQVQSYMLDSSLDNQTTEYSKQSLESENILLKKTVAQFQKDFLRMEAHCIALELKYKNQALKSGKHGQILNETSIKAKIKKEIDVLETMNIELKHNVAKLRKENKTLKKHYKDLYDSIKITRSKTIEQTTSWLANNADLKAQIQEKVFEVVALKNDLRKLKGNSVDTKPQMSKPWFASQVDVNNNLSRPVTQHYLPKRREFAFAKPDHMIASSESRNSSKNMPRFSSNDMVHNHYLDEGSPNKTSAVYEKTSPISDLRWKPTGTIFKSVGLRWIPTRKLFDSCTSKVNSEPTHGSNVDIPNIHKSKQTLDLSAVTSINVQKEQSFDLSAVVSKSSAVTTDDASDKRQQQPDSTSSTSTLATTVTADGNFDL
ncbi:hypothetical protein Tco_0971909 [Tanacetum coccineum]